MKILRFDSLESTNKYCELLDLNQVEEFTVIWASSQTGGVGQQGSRWESQPGKNLTISIVLHPSFLPAHSQFLLTQMLSLAVADYLRDAMPSQSVAIKWPNDIYLGHKKICGILTTTRIANTHIASAVCGLGLNVNQQSFSADIPNPVSMALQSGHEFDLEEVLTALLSHIEHRYKQLRNEDADLIKNDYQSLLLHRGSLARYRHKGREITATIQGTDAYGHLVLTEASGQTLTCDIKEIQFIIES